MGQKVHPIGFRLGVTTKHSSTWFAKVRKSNQYSRFLAEDTFIREFLLREVPTVHHVLIQRKNSALFLHLEVGQPNDVLPNLEKIKIQLQKELFLQSQKIVLATSHSVGSSRIGLQKPYVIFCTVAAAQETTAQSVAFLLNLNWKNVFHFVVQ